MDSRNRVARAVRERPGDAFAWHFGTTTAGLDSRKADFLATAVHEISHVLELGEAQSWFELIEDGEVAGTIRTRRILVHRAPAAIAMIRVALLTGNASVPEPYFDDALTQFAWAAELIDV